MMNKKRVCNTQPHYLYRPANRYEICWYSVLVWVGTSTRIQVQYVCVTLIYTNYKACVFHTMIDSLNKFLFCSWNNVIITGLPAIKDVGGCYGDTIKVTCSRDHVINILHDYHGLSKDGACHSSVDVMCSVPTIFHRSDVRRQCNGQQTCLYTVRDRNECSYNGKLNQTNFLHVDYECISCEWIVGHFILSFWYVSWDSNLREEPVRSQSVDNQVWILDVSSLPANVPKRLGLCVSNLQ